MKIIVRSPNWIGDAVLCLSSIEYLKEKIPQSHITVLAKDWVKDIFLNHPVVDEVIPFNNHKGIKSANFDVGILFTNSFSSAFLFFLAGIKKRTGYKTDLRSIFLTDGIPLPKNLEKLHQKDYYFEIVKKLTPGNETPKNPTLYLTDEEIEKADNTLKNLGINDNPQSPLISTKSEHGDKSPLYVFGENKGGQPVTSSTTSMADRRNPLVGIFPGASYGPAKMWGAEKFKALAEKFVRNGNKKILIFGGNKEKDLGNKIQNETFGIINLCGKTTMRELMALIKKCDVFVTNDTGPMHMASALNVPVVAIFGPTNTHRTSPLGPSTIIKKEVSCSPCKHRICPLKHHDCMEKISVEEVFEAVETTLK